jgi:hypothetical protein
VRNIQLSTPPAFQMLAGFAPNFLNQKNKIHKSIIKMSTSYLEVKEGKDNLKVIIVKIKM